MPWKTSNNMLMMASLASLVCQLCQKLSSPPGEPPKGLSQRGLPGLACWDNEPGEGISRLIASPLGCEDSLGSLGGPLCCGLEASLPSSLSVS